MSYSTNNTVKKRFIYFGILFLFIVILSAVVVTFLQYNEKQSTIYFFINGEKIEARYDDVISDSYLNSLMNNVQKEVGYDYVWSYSNEIYDKVDFSNIKKNSTIYLFAIKHKYNITFDTPSLYSIINDGSYEYGNDFIFTFEDDVIVYINSERIEKVNDLYSFRITDDALIKATKKELIKIKPLDCDYVYDGLKKEFLFELDTVPTSGFELSLDVKYYSDNLYQNEVEPINAGKYYVKVMYQGNDYIFETQYYELVISKLKPQVDVESINIYNECLLRDISLNKATYSTKGTLSWQNGDEIVYQTGKYKAVFVPDDSNYEEVIIEVIINYATEEEMLEVVNREVIELKTYFDTVDWVEQGLPTSDDIVHLNWYSLSTCLSIIDGKVNIIGDVSNYDVQIVCIVLCGNASEYVVFEEVINSESESLLVEDDNEENISPNNTEIVLASEVNKDCVLGEEKQEEYVLCNLNCEIILDEENEERLEKCSNADLSEFIDLSSDKLIEYEGPNLSEIIVWKIISSKDKSDNDNSITIKNSFIQKMKKGVIYV